MIRKKIIACFFLSILFKHVHGQDSTTVKKSKTGIAAIPIITYNRTQGVVLGAMVSGFFKLNGRDTISPSSSVGAFGIYTAQKSYVVFAHSQLYLAEDKWRIMAAAGTVNSNFQFYFEDPIVSIGNFYDYTTNADIILLQLQENIYRRIYFGPTGTFVKAQTTFGIADLTGKDSTTQSNLNSIGYIFSNDTRDHVIYPSSGIFINFKNQFYRDWVGSDFEFVRYILTYNQFFKVHKDEKNIIAIRANLNIATGDVPFEGQTVVGGDDIRGYSQGQYRNDQVYSVQGEYRWNFYRKWGMVGFAGVATAVKKFSDIPDEEILPGLGAGIRFRMIPKEKVNVGIDVAFGKNDYSLTFRIGEAFGR